MMKVIVKNVGPSTTPDIPLASLIRAFTVQSTILPVGASVEAEFQNPPSNDEACSIIHAWASASGCVLEVLFSPSAGALPPAMEQPSLPVSNLPPGSIPVT